mgnify:FL=1
MTMNLYELTSAYQHLLKLIDEGEDYNAALDEIRGTIEEKAENYAKVIRTLEAERDAYGEEADRFLAKKQARSNDIDRIKAHLIAGMETVGITNVKGKVHTVALQASPPSVEVWDEERVPHSLIKASLNVPYSELPAELAEQATRSVNKKAAIEAWKETGQTADGLSINVNNHIRIR